MKISFRFNDSILKGKFFTVITIYITTSNPDITSHSCNWIGHCLNDPCVTYDDWYVLKVCFIKTNINNFYLLIKVMLIGFAKIINVLKFKKIKI